MGMNFISCCHKCKKKKFHFRRKENETMIPFYRKHYDCILEFSKNVETFEDQLQEKAWMSEYEED